MAEPAGDDAFRSSWLALPVAVIWAGVDQRRPRMTIEIRTGDAPMTIESHNGQVWVEPRRARWPDLVLTGPPDGVVGVLTGALDETSASDRGVSMQGDADRLAQLRSPGSSFR
jgi:hypothetical protein